MHKTQEETVHSQRVLLDELPAVNQLETLETGDLAPLITTAGNPAKIIAEKEFKFAWRPWTPLGGRTMAMARS